MSFYIISLQRNAKGEYNELQPRRSKQDRQYRVLMRTWAGRFLTLTVDVQNGTPVRKTFTEWNTFVPITLHFHRLSVYSQERKTNVHESAVLDRLQRFYSYEPQPADNPHLRQQGSRWAVYHRIMDTDQPQTEGTADTRSNTHEPQRHADRRGWAHMAMFRVISFIGMSSTDKTNWWCKSKQLLPTGVGGSERERGRVLGRFSTGLLAVGIYIHQDACSYTFEDLCISLYGNFNFYLKTESDEYSHLEASTSTSSVKAPCKLI